jgi:hypothetical protein
VSRCRPITETPNSGGTDLLFQVEPGASTGWAGFFWELLNRCQAVLLGRATEEPNRLNHLI